MATLAGDGTRKSLVLVGSQTGMDSAGAGNFWEPRQYKYCVRRIEDGYKLLSDMQTMIKERADLETNYGASLRGWSKKWGNFIRSGSQYQSTLDGICCLFTEADNMAELHFDIRDQLLRDESQIKLWQKENYPKNWFGQLRFARQVDKDFKHAQKPWNAQLHKVNKACKSYHIACKHYNSSRVHAQNAENDSAMSEEQREKMRQRVAQAEQDMGQTRADYEQQLQALAAMANQYDVNMRSVFQPADVTERQRLMFLKEVLQNLHRSLDPSLRPTLAQTTAKIREQLVLVNPEADLAWWTKTHGPDLPFVLPSFQPYQEPIYDIGKSSRNKSGDGVILTGIRAPQTTLNGDSDYKATTLPRDVSAVGAKNGRTYSEGANGVGEVSHTDYELIADAPNGHLDVDHSPRRPPLTTSTPADETAVRRRLSERGQSTILANGASASNGTVITVNAPTVSSGGSVRRSEQVSPVTNGSLHKTDVFTNGTHSHSPTDTGTSPGAASPSSHSTSAEASASPADDVRLTRHADSDAAYATMVVAGADLAEQTVNGTGGHHLTDSEDDSHSDGAGLLMRATFAYEAQDSDELTLKAGDVFTMISPADHLGWATGNLNGTIGLYPATYAVPISPKRI